MTENRSNLQKYAMHFGTYMGIYWTLKFILFPLGISIPFLLLLFVLLTLAVPFIGYHYTKMYRDKICGGSIRLSHAILFSIFMYMFASLLVAVAHYIYFQFIDHGFIIDFYVSQIDSLNKMQDNISASPSEREAIANMTALLSNKEAIAKMIDTARTLTPINITMELLSSDMIWGTLLSIPTGLLVMKKANPKSKENNELPQQ